MDDDETLKLQDELMEELTLCPGCSANQADHPHDIAKCLEESIEDMANYHRLSGL